MKIVISCANRKNGKTLIYNKKEINFVSHVDQVGTTFLKLLETINLNFPQDYVSFKLSQIES